MVPMAEEPLGLRKILPLQETWAKTSRLLTTVVLRSSNKTEPIYSSRS